MDQSDVVQRRVAFAIVLVIVAGCLLYVVSDVLLPFVAGAALAYLLDPVADRLERIGASRLSATILIVGAFVLALVVVVLIVVPILVQQVASFAEQLPGYVERLQRLLAEQGEPLVRRIGGEEALAQVQRQLGEVVGQGAAWVATFLRSLWSGGKAVISILSLLVVTPVVAFYLLFDWDRMIATIDDWVPPRNRATVRMLGREMDHAVAGFVRGQSTVCLILGSFYAAGLALVGLNFGVLIGMFAGLISFIPYVGSLTGLVLALGVATVQFAPEWRWVLATLGVFLVGQFFEGNILSPKLVGASAGLHPVWVMFALLAFGSMFGFLGLILAVPLAAIVGVLTRFAIRRYQGSDLYLAGTGSHLLEAREPAGPTVRE